MSLFLAATCCLIYYKYADELSRIIRHSYFFCIFVAMNGRKPYIAAMLSAVGALILGACASMGRPEGGPRDVAPPQFVRANPSPGQLNVKTNKLSIEFDENIQVKEAMTKVVISPAQKIMPLINAYGKRISVELRDTLIPDATYTIDFADAISDLNEGNEIDGFAYAFSTGDVIDSLQISGMVFAAENLEPAQGMVVGVYSNLSDTAITTLPLERITKTNQYGQFTLRNLAPGTYNLFAINDANRDYHWDRSEDIAVYPVQVIPTAGRSEHTDTLITADGRDSVYTHMSTDFGPNDILLTWFNENYRPQYLERYDRSDFNRVIFQMAAPSDTLPTITILNGPRAGSSLYDVAVLDRSLTCDTLDFWLADSLVIAQDSLEVVASYQRTDSLDELAWQTDTLRLYVRSQLKRQHQKALDDAAKERKKRLEKGDSTVEEPPAVDFRQASGGAQDVHRPLFFTASEPLDTFDQSGVHLEVADDTLWIALEPPVFSLVNPAHPLRFTAPYEWEPGAKYRLTVDSASMRSIYGKANRPVKYEFNVRKLSDYSKITFNLSGISLDDHPVVELLNSSDKPVARVAAEGLSVVFEHVLPGTYFARLFADRNANGKWDTGSVADSVQPEDVYYYSKPISLKQNWDAVLTWNVSELPVDQQKPVQIKKNKPKRKPGEQPESDEEEEEEDAFGNPGAINENPFDRTGRNRRNSSTDPRQLGSGGRGGAFRQSGNRRL